MGRKKSTLQERFERMTLRRRVKYDEQTAFIELFKPSCQLYLIVGPIAGEFRSLLRNGDKVNIRTLTYLDFRISADNADHKESCAHKQIYQFLHQLLKFTGCKGTMFGKSMIFRYITDGHSNLSISEKSLETAVNKAFDGFS